MDEIKANRRSELNLAPLALAVILLLAAAIYAACYVGLSYRLDPPHARIRLYQRAWQVTLFKPAAVVESLCIRHQVAVDQVPRIEN